MAKKAEWIEKLAPKESEKLKKRTDELQQASRDLGSFRATVSLDYDYEPAIPGEYRWKVDLIGLSESKTRQLLAVLQKLSRQAEREANPQIGDIVEGKGKILSIQKDQAVVIAAGFRATKKRSIQIGGLVRVPGEKNTWRQANSSSTKEKARR